MSQSGTYFSNSGPGGFVQTITGNDGIPAVPTAGNINIVTANATVKVLNTAVSTETIDFALTSNLALGSSLPSLAGGSNNTALGVAAGAALTTGSSNTLIGWHAGNDLTIGSNNVFIGRNTGDTVTSAGTTVIIGDNAATDLTVGQGCVGIGNSCSVGQSGTNNIVMGNGAGGTMTSGSRNIIIGPGSGGNYTSTESSNLLIYNTGVASESNTIRIGTQGNLNGQQNVCYIAGIASVAVANTNMVTINTATGQLGSQAVPITISWSVITVNQTAVVNNGYFCNKAGTLALALPTSSNVGDIIEVANINTATGVQITQGSGQQIFIGNTSTTSGVSGSLTSSALGDTLKLVCRAANTTFQVVSMIGNWSVV